MAKAALCGFWATVCKTVRPMLSVRCLSVLSVTFVHCVQAAGRTKMKLGMQVGLNSASPPLKGVGAPIFGPYLLHPNGWMDQHATWYGGRPQPRRLCVRWGPRSTLPKNGGSAPSQLSAHFYCGQTAPMPLHASRCHLVWR